MLKYTYSCLCDYIALYACICLSIAEFTLRFLICYFFRHNVIIFVTPLLFVQDGVKKVTTTLFFCIVSYKTMQTFDIVLIVL